MNHNQLMTGLILAIILGLASFLLYRVFFNESQESSSAAVHDGAEIEETLKKILAQTSAGAAASATATSIATEGEVKPATGGAAPAGADVEKLRSELAANQKLIAELKATAASGAAGADQTPELLAKIKILEDRLLEYEIIEDDIADLSIYKEENAKLKKELEGLKGGAVLKNEAAAEAIDAVAAAAAPAVAAADPTPTPVDPGQVQTAVSTPVDEAEAVAAQLMAEKSTDAAPAPTPATAAPEAPAPTPEPAPAAGSSTTVTSTENVQGSSDVFAEFQGGENADPLAGLGDLDADRMLEEIKDLGEGSGDAGVLEEAVDLDKMAKETSTKG